MIRFCRGPLKPEELTADDCVVYQHHMFVYAAMGDMAWSFVELLNQCQYHEQYGSRAHLYKALVELQEIGMVRTDDAMFADEAATRMGRALTGTFTYEDIKWRNGALVMRHGGPCFRWVVELFGENVRLAMRGCENVLEIPAGIDDDRFTITFQRRSGKTAMQLRREVLDKVKALADVGGATAEQLRAILDDAASKEPAPGLAMLPNQEEHEQKYPHILYFGDKLRCQRCGVEQGISFPTTDPNASIQLFIKSHERCLPMNAAPGDLLRALREEKRAT